MPTYDYRCPKCGNEFEAFQPISAPPNANCPVCGEPAKRMISTGIGVIFKGTGFYQTDYKQKDEKTLRERKKKDSKPSVEPKAETKTETKAETKADKKESAPKTEKNKE
jgi:putative FmdB family regulatory protein